jgi:hypothetical protein
VQASNFFGRRRLSEQKIANYKEEFSYKTPHSTLHATSGYRFISLSQREKFYGNYNELLQPLLTSNRRVKVEPTDLEIRVS